VFGGAAHQLPLTDPARHTAIHGLVSWSRWGLVEQSAEAVTLEFHLPAQAGYPWSLLLRVRWSVGPDGLRADHEVRNTSDQDAPFGFSAHPYFKLPGVAVDDALLQVPARIRALSDSRLLPIGTVKIAGSELDYAEPRRIGDAVLDVTFGDVEHEPDGSSTVRLTGPGGQPALAVWADGQFRWWQVFSADTLQGPRRRRAVAIEPMSCPPDAFRSGRDLTVLAPQQTWRGSWGVRPRLG
jgi:aldose 1-epimerase